jgi:hypothetical protein
LQDRLNGLVVVSLDLEVHYPAVALGCGNLAVPKLKLLKINRSSTLMIVLK